ncbi:uncharacterized protein LOC125501904 [Athalia rosae]|uniref:uncharacterized protein LOC125501904 n=1 Tax=Athalia rosae TaxID=37344 RepID=UPI00203419E0|nr:uncharacterized protein LOC125501904 [Athalia rosae]
MASKAAKPVAISKTPKIPDADATASLQFSLPQMLDIALGTPEVPFKFEGITQRVSQISYEIFRNDRCRTVTGESSRRRLRGCNAIKNSNSPQNVATAARMEPSLHLHEYNIIESSGKVKQRIHSDEDLTVKVDVYSEGSIGSRSKKSKGSRLRIGGNSEGEAHSVIFVEPIIDGAFPTALGFRQLEDTIRKLQADFRALEELATTPEMIERIKTNSTDPVTDMWHIINITKRLDAAEKGIDKITEMVQDLIKSDKVLSVGRTSSPGVEQQGTGDLTNQINEIEKRMTDLEKRLTYENDGNANAEDKPAGFERKPSIRSTNTQSEKRTTDADGDLVALKIEITQVRKDLDELSGRIGNANHGESTKNPADVVVKSEPGDPADHGESTKNPADVVVKSEPGDPADDAESSAALPNETAKIFEQMHGMEAMFEQATQEILRRVHELEKDVGCLIEKSNSAPMAGVATDGSQAISELVGKIQTIQTDMENMNQTANRLLDERETRETHTNALLEQIELLKTIKADKEDLEEALADKADAHAVNRKVSYAQFDAVCDDLTRGLEDAVSKLSQQEGIWQKTLDDVQQEIEGKLDKIEISPLKDFVNNKLKSLQDKLKAVSEMRRENEAAGSKKLLRDVQCISCDKNVVMKMQEGMSFHAEALPCTRSIKPYLTYELDQVRRHQKKLPHGRNMIQFEAAMQEEARKTRAVSRNQESLEKSPRQHLCNRYCGGSHTVTTPQQRVMRMGHFLNQWGPEAIQLTEGVIKGTDGQMYRSRALPTSPEICRSQEAGDQRKPDEVPASPSRPFEPRSASVASSRLAVRGSN